MNALEKLGLNELRIHLREAMKRVDNNNDGKMENQRIYIEGDLKRAFEVLKALEENS